MQIVSATVGSTRCAISLVTGRLVKIEMPRSPCSRPQTQVAELDAERLVEPELRADAGDVVGGRGVAGDDRRRVARAQMQQREDEQRDHRHDRDGRQDAPDDVGEHTLSPPRRTLRRTRESGRPWPPHATRVSDASRSFLLDVPQEDHRAR